jgi:hypothetical protein
MVRDLIVAVADGSMDFGYSGQMLLRVQGFTVI